MPVSTKGKLVKLQGVGKTPKLVDLTKEKAKPKASVASTNAVPAKGKSNG